jgi:uncharacterized OB-fold protein
MTPLQIMAQHAAEGKFALQCCRDCDTAQYPPRELCHVCLSDRLDWQMTTSRSGQVLAVTTLHHSHDPVFRHRLPITVGLVQLDAGPVAVCFLDAQCRADDPVIITVELDAASRPVLFASPLH